MAVENELVYIIRLTPEGEQEVVKATRVIDQTGQSVDKVNKKFGSYKSTLGSAGKASKDFSKQTSSANIALLDLTRIAQDAPYGIRGIANNLEQAASSAGNAYQRFGSFKGLLGGLASSLTGAGGLVLGVTALTLVLQGAENGLFSFGKQTKDFAADSEQMIKKLQTINDELAKLKGFDSDSFFVDKGDLDALRRLNVVEEDIKDQIRSIQALTNPENLNLGQLREAASQGRLNKNRQGDILSVDLSDEQLKKLHQYQADLKSIGVDLDKLREKRARTERLKSYPTIQTAEQQRKALAAAKTLSDLQIDLKKQTDSKLEALEAEKLQQIKKIDQNENLNDSQKAKAKTLITQTYAAQETEIRKAQAEKQKQIATDKAAAVQKADAFLAKQQVEIAQTSGNTQRALELQKAQDIAQIKDRFAKDDKRRKEALDNLDKLYAAKEEARVQKKRQKEARETAKALEQRARARQQFDQMLISLQTANASAHDQPYLKLYNQTQDEISKVRSLYNQNVINKQQEQSAITAIEKNYSNKRKIIAQQESNKKIQLEMQESQIRKAAQLETLSAFSNQLAASFQQSKAVAVATGTANAILAGINTAKTVSEFAPPPIPQIAGAAMAALQLVQVAKIKNTSLSGSGSSSGTTSYRGFDFGSDQVRNPAADRVRQGGPDRSGSTGSGGRKESREITIKDGLGNIVARGQEEIDRRGGSNYLRGGK